MSKKIDLTGQRFGRLVVVEEAGHAKDGRVLWFCKCDCGGYTSTPSTKTLRNGTCRSCGCIERERPNKMTHGKSNTKLFYVWNSMKQRCSNPHTKDIKTMAVVALGCVKSGQIALKRFSNGL